MVGFQILTDWGNLLEYKNNSKSSLCVSGCINFILTEINNTFAYQIFNLRKETKHNDLDGKTFMQYFIENNKDFIRVMVVMCEDNNAMKLIFQENMPFSKWKQFNRWNSISWDNIVSNLKKHPNRFNNNNMALKTILSLIYKEFKEHRPKNFFENIISDRFNTIEDFMSTIYFYQEWVKYKTNKTNKNDNKLMNMNDDIILNILIGSSNTDLMNYISKFKKRI